MYNANISSDISRKKLLVKVAKMYYLDGLTQEEISRRIHVSRSNVSRFLKKCVEEKIVEFIIDDISSIGIELQDKLKECFNLANAVVVPTDTNPETNKANVAKAAVLYLESILRDGMLLGVSWGTTLYYVAKQCNINSKIRVDVIQLVAGTGAKSIDTDGQELAKSFAIALNGTSYILNTPFLVQSKVLKDLLLEEPDIRKHFERVFYVDVAVVGLGSNRPELSALYRSGYLTNDECRQLIKMGAVGEICGRHLDINGNPCATNISNRVVGIELRQLKNIPRVVAVAAGTEKADAIISVLRGGYLNSLIVDEATALSVLTLESRKKNLTDTKKI